jgi:type I restriction enzyme S subunit
MSFNILEDWKEKKIGDCIELIYGKGLPERRRKKGNIPVFGSNGIVGFHDEAIVKAPGIIIGRKGSVGEVAFSKQDFWSIDTTYYVQTKKGNDILFWYYFLMTLGLKQMNTHSAVPGLNRDGVIEIVRAIPNLIEQHAIASVLGSFDDKIELNRQMNATLEKIGQAIFKHWFVDFEFPNKEGKSYKSSGGEMVDSELGEIPKGWKTQSIYSCARYINGDAFRNTDFSFDRTGLPIVKIAELKYGITSQTEFTKKDIDPKYKITNGGLINIFSK